MAAAAEIREAHLSDLDEIVAWRLQFDFPRRTRSEIAAFWSGNPASGGNSRIGWVLDAGRIVGFIGSIPLCYYSGTNRLRAAMATSFFVAPEFRGQSVQLASRFFQQPEVDLFLCTSSNSAASAVHQVLKARPWPNPSWPLIAYTILRSRPFLHRALSSWRVPGPLARTGSYALAPLLAVSSRLRFAIREEAESGLSCEHLPLSDIGSEFDELWNRKIREGAQLLALRTAEALRWHWSCRQNRTVRMVACRKNRVLRGYATLITEEGPASAGRRTRVVDILVAEEDAVVTRALFQAALRSARGDGSYVLELPCPPQKMLDALACYPLRIRRRQDGPPMVKFGRQSSEMTRPLGGQWHCTAFDSDAFL